MSADIKIQPVILCGGSGSRLWPLSRIGFPKQFLSLTGGDTLFQQAAKRLINLKTKNIQPTAPLIVTGEEYRFIALEQLREISVQPSTVFLEPVARNTAPALTFAALAAIEDHEDPILVVTPADQTVADSQAFTNAMHNAIRQASEGGIVILGVTPDRPDTGYGYIQVRTNSEKSSLFVERFVEKPDLVEAQRYLDEGNFYWNAGIFVLRASVWLDAIASFRPDIAKTSHDAWNSRTRDVVYVRPGESKFLAIPADSIDYAVLERCPSSHFSVRMEPLDAGWSDLGAWDAVWRELPKDSNGNVSFGDALMINSRNSLINSSSRLVGLVGVENLVVIETPDAVLVADKSQSQEVKKIVNDLQDQKREESSVHRKVYRPWGWYDCIDAGDCFKVKRIQVNPGASLSLQKHQHRAEHWVIVKGTAEIICGNKRFVLTENQSTYIPFGEVHRLTNPGAIPLEIIEVQSGNYLGEDDIIRIEDQYGRVEK
jgi:mannose-1-phosphate guanylyltransferase/mannose-6-phosphate isomerase